jgi:hypothetical protein
MIKITFSKKSHISFYTSHSGKRVEPFTGTDVMPRETFQFLEVSKSIGDKLFLVCTDGQLASVNLKEVASIGWDNQ